ncbi:MAG: squalene/phytoene synthase family protein [Phycisphaerales bacterium]
MTGNDQELAGNTNEQLRREAGRADENFTVLSPLLPKEFVGDFASVYAFCRRADDLADDVDPTPTGRALALERLRGSAKLWTGISIPDEPPTMPLTRTTRCSPNSPDPSSDARSGTSTSTIFSTLSNRTR